VGRAAALDPSVPGGGRLLRHQRDVAHQQGRRRVPPPALALEPLRGGDPRTDRDRPVDGPRREAAHQLRALLQGELLMAAAKTTSFETLPLGGRLALLGLLIALVGVIYATAFHFP